MDSYKKLRRSNNDYEAALRKVSVFLGGISQKIAILRRRYFRIFTCIAPHLHLERYKLLK
jgi:hypothetical protein